MPARRVVSPTSFSAPKDRGPAFNPILATPNDGQYIATLAHCAGATGAARLFLRMSNSLLSGSYRYDESEQQTTKEFSAEGPTVLRPTGGKPHQPAELPGAVCEPGVRCGDFPRNP